MNNLAEAQVIGLQWEWTFILSGLSSTAATYQLPLQGDQ